MINFIFMCLLNVVFSTVGINVDEAESPQQSVAEERIAQSSTIVLYPKDADLSYAQGVIVEPQSPPYNLGGWKGSAKVIFPVQIEQEGTYAVEVLYSLNAYYTNRVLVVASQDILKQNLETSPHIYGRLPSTGNNWHNYKITKLGELVLNKGKNFIVISSVSQDDYSYLMNLRELRLVKQ